MDFETYVRLNGSKTDKAVPAAAGNLAALTAAGDLSDSGLAPDALARRDGYYPSLRAGSADDLAGGLPMAGERFLFRPTAARRSAGTWIGADVKDGTAELRAIYGGAVLYRQLCAATVTQFTVKGVEVTAEDNVFRLTATSDTAMQKKAELAVKRGHVFFAICSVRGDGTLDSATFALQRESGSAVAGGAVTLTETWQETFFCGRAEADRDNTFVLRLPNAALTGAWAEFRDVMLFDLTESFGDGNEPEGEEFRRTYARTYLPFSRIGRLLPFRGTAVRTVGFNAFDPESGCARVVGGAEYAVGGTFGVASFTPDGGGETSVAIADGRFTPPEDGVLRLAGTDADTCVHLRWSGARDGDTEAYWRQTLALPVSDTFGDGMREARSAARTVRDELTPTEAVRRVGSVRMQSLTWVSADGRYTAVLPEDAAEGDGAAGDCGLICVLTNRYVRNDAILSMTNRTFTTVKRMEGGTLLVVRDTSYTTIGAFRASLTADDVVWYELAEPVVTTFAHPLNLTLKTSDWGTEEVLCVPGTLTAPMRADLSYGYNVRDFVRRAYALQPFCRFVSDVPASTDAPGTPGTIAAAGGYAYLCIGTGWLRLRAEE